MEEIASLDARSKGQGESHDILALVTDPRMYCAMAFLSWMAHPVTLIIFYI